MGTYFSGFAKEVVVDELSISLYNKPVTGFRFTLERSERFVANQIIAHVAAVEATPPFQYERSIIYENIRYSPIAEDRDLSLYFLLKSIQGQFTELTIVVMYDYRRSINSREFPELATELKIDIAKLVKETSGDVARFGDLLLDDAAIAKLEKVEKEPVAKDSGPKTPVAEHFKSEEVENETVLLRRDPFKNESKQPNENKQNSETKSQVNDTTLQRLNARIQALEARESQLIAEAETQRIEQASLQRKHDILASKVKDTKRLQDSITMLNERVEALIGQSYVADDVSISNETASEMANLEKEAKRLNRLNAKLEAENDSLLGVAIRYSEQLTRLSAGGKSTAEQMAKLSSENEGLRVELQEYKTKLAMGLGEGQGLTGTAAADSLLDLLSQAQVKNIALRDEAEVRERNLGRLKEDNDYLNGKKMQLEERINSLEAENRNLREGNAEVVANLPNENLIDSLNGEIRTARRAAGTAKSELTQTQTEMAALQKAKDEQERRLVAAESEQKKLQAQIAALESGNTVAKTNPAPALDDAANKAMADSILILKQQLQRAQATAKEATATKEALTKVQTDLQTKDRELRKAQTDLASRNLELSEAVKAKSALQKSLSDAEARLAENSSSRSATQQEVDRLKQENKNLTNNLSAKEQLLSKANSDNKMLSDSAIAMRVQRSALRKELSSNERQLRAQTSARDSLQGLLSTVGQREADLRRSISALQSRVDSLGRVRVPEGEQARFLREQRAKLDQQEKDLAARDVATADKEKLLSQRESVLQRKEADYANKESRFKDLEERERRVQLLEQQVNSKEGTSVVDNNTPILIREGRVLEYGNQIPVFIVESSLATTTSERQAIGYFLNRQELYDDRFPDLQYRTAKIVELDASPVEVKIRIDARGAGSILQISFRLEDGEYIGGDKYPERIATAKQLISKMLRYKI
jgi:hypothetical protein